MSNTFFVIGHRKIDAATILLVKATISGVEITLENGDIYYLSNYSVEEMVNIVNNAKENLI
jgi:hypothetical protein